MLRTGHAGVNYMKDKKKQKAGRLGAQATHRERYRIITELSKYVHKDDLNYMMSWKTEQLKRLLKAYEKRR